MNFIRSFVISSLIFNVLFLPSLSFAAEQKDAIVIPTPHATLPPPKNGSNHLLLAVATPTAAETAEAAKNPPLPTPIGRVVWVKGTLKAVMTNHETRILQKQSLIFLQDTLTTDTNSQAEVIFTDNSLLTLANGSKLVIDQYTFDRKKSVGKSVMSLIEGGFRTITGAMVKNSPTDYQVNTPVSTMGVRGTDYAVYLQGKHSCLSAYKGVPCISNKKGQELCLSTEAKYAEVAGPDDAQKR